MNKCMWGKTTVWAGAAWALVALAGCGLVTEKDLIKVAKIGDRYITRGDLSQYLRLLPDDQRPKISTRGDLGHALRMMVDARLKEDLAIQLEKEGKIHVSLEAAAERFYQRYPELRVQIGNPQDFNLTEDQLKAIEAEKQAGIDRMQRLMLADAAISYLAREGLQDGQFVPTKEEFEQAYEFRKGELRTFERVAFVGLGFPASSPEARGAAAQAKQRLDQQESIETIIDEYARKGLAFPMNSEIENNPSVERFKGFWQQATGAKPGDVVGPVYVTGMQAIATDASGKQVSHTLPESYLVAIIVESYPERDKTLEEAQRDLLPDIVLPKVMKRLYEEKRVEFYENKLPDPAFYGKPGGG